jgi:uncharacterized membrane protein YdbT with pleckstrin-like domain
MYPEEAARVAPEQVFKYLLPSERCVFAVRRHIAMLAVPGLAVIGVLFVAFFLDSTLPQNAPAVRDVVWLAWFAVFVWFAWRFADWWVERFVVTDRRIMLTSGLLTRKVAMMPLIKVTDMSYERPLLGRILGYGEFVMESAGQDQALRNVTYVPNPDILYLDMCDLLFGQQNVDGG